MSNTLKTVVAVVIIIILGALTYYLTKPAVPVKTVTPIVVEQQPTESVLGCYVATLSKDVYTLTVTSQEEENFAGKLSFKNFEKDSSSGTYAGTYKDGILLGDYSFQSEGMDSVMQVIFKKVGDDFVRGYGDVDTATGTRFTDLSKITYDSKAMFKGQACAEAGV